MWFSDPSSMCLAWRLWIFLQKIMEGVNVLVFLKMSTFVHPSLNFTPIEIILLISGRAKAGLLAGSATVETNALAFAKISRKWKCLQICNTSCRGVFRKLISCDRIIDFAFLLWRRTCFWAEKHGLCPGFSPSMVHVANTIDNPKMIVCIAYFL